MFTMAKEITVETYEELIGLDNDILVLAHQGEYQADLWVQLNQLDQLLIDCTQQQELCQSIQIVRCPQLLYVSQNQIFFYMDDFEFQKIQLWVHHLSSHPEDSAEYEEEYEILISIEDPPPYNENDQWVENIVEDLHDHHSEILEQSQYGKLLELKTFNENLFQNQEIMKLEIKRIFESMENIEEVVSEISLSANQELDVENYLYLLTICIAISLIIMQYQMKKIHHTNILVIQKA